MVLNPFSLFRSVMPKEDRFLSGFARHADTAVRAAEHFRLVASDPDNRRAHFDRLRAVEEEADDITCEVVLVLHQTNIAPFDREDIHALISAQDDIVDLMKKAAWNIILYQIEITPQMVGMIDCVGRAVTTIHDMLPMLGNISRNAERINVACAAIGAIESEADDLLRLGQWALFHEDMRPRGEKVFDNEIFEFIEAVADRCEDLADIVQGIVIKSA